MKKKQTKNKKSTPIKFNFDLGKGLSVLDANIKIYGLSNAKPVLITEQESNGKSFKLAIEAADFSLFQVVALLQKVKLKKDKITIVERNIQLTATFDTYSKSVEIGEHSTIANAYNFCQLTTISKKNTIQISASKRALNVAYKMKNNFSLTAGGVSMVIQSAPNGLQTNSYPLFNSLANIVYYSIIDEGFYKSFMNLSSSDASFYSGLLHLILNPFDNAQEIYNIINEQQQIYKPSLSTIRLPKGRNDLPQFNQWTLTLKLNDSGAQNFLISGPGNIAFDKNDRAWISNNVRQGTFNSSTFVTVLNSDGTPVPHSPLFGGGLLGGAFGITTDAKKEKIYIGNYGWGITDNNPQTGSISVFNHKGKAISPPNGFCNKLNRVQGMEFDSKGHLWMCSWGSQDPLTPFDPESPYQFEDAPSAVVVYLNGNPKKALIFKTNKKHRFFGPFSLVIDSNDHVIVSNSGNKKLGSSVYKFKLSESGKKIEYITHWKSNWDQKNGYEWFKQVQVNSKDEIFVAGTDSSRIVKLDQNLKYCGAYTHNIFGPWGITIDQNDQMYIANFGYGTTEPERLGVSIIPAGEEPSSDGNNNIELMNLPTGGKQVTLANGFSLYGQVVVSSTPKGEKYQTPKCYQPLMLLTASGIDKAGNLWTLSNFKPSFALDLLTNPGGDGMVIFIGVAHPR